MSRPLKHFLNFGIIHFFWFESSKKMTIGWLESFCWGYFNSSILSYVSISVSDFSKSVSLKNSSIFQSMSSSLRMFAIMLIGIKLLKRSIVFDINLDEDLVSICIFFQFRFSMFNSVQNLKLNLLGILIWHIPLVRWKYSEMDLSEITIYPFNEFKNIQRVILTLIEGLMIVHVIKLMKDGLIILLGVDRSKYWIKITILSFSLSVKLLKISCTFYVLLVSLTYSSVLFITYIFLMETIISN